MTEALDSPFAALLAEWGLVSERLAERTKKHGQSVLKIDGFECILKPTGEDEQTIAIAAIAEGVRIPVLEFGCDDVPFLRFSSETKTLSEDERNRVADIGLTALRTFVADDSAAHSIRTTIAGSPCAVPIESMAPPEPAKDLDSGKDFIALQPLRRLLENALSASSRRMTARDAIRRMILATDRLAEDLARAGLGQSGDALKDHLLPKTREAIAEWIFIAKDPSTTDGRLALERTEKALISLAELLEERVETSKIGSLSQLSEKINSAVLVSRLVDPIPAR